MLKNLIIFYTLIEISIGVLQSRIIGGSNVPYGSMPYQVSIQIYNKHECGGAIINNKFILTAAHCMTGLDPNHVTIVTGVTKLSINGTVYKAKRIIAHENFKLMQNDIALIRVSKPIEFTDTIQPIKISTEDVNPGEKVILSGWGSTVYPNSKEHSDELKMVHLETISNENCRKGLGQKIIPIYESNLCTYTKRGEGACHADSGGPLVNYAHELVGLISWGKPCGVGKPDVYTRVSSFLDWIKQNQHW